MLTISKPLSAGQAQSYHAEEFGNARENYYTEGEQIRGEWHGRLAEQWGLRGEVREEQFQRLSRRATSDHRRATSPPPSRQRIRERARREGKRDGTPRRMGRDVFRPEERIADGPGGSEMNVSEKRIERALASHLTNWSDMSRPASAGIFRRRRPANG